MHIKKLNSAIDMATNLIQTGSIFTPIEKVPQSQRHTLKLLGVEDMRKVVLLHDAKERIQNNKDLMNEDYSVIAIGLKAWINEIKYGIPHYDEKYNNQVRDLSPDQQKILASIEDLHLEVLARNLKPSNGDYVPDIVNPNMTPLRAAQIKDMHDEPEPESPPVTGGRKKFNF